MSPDQQQQDHRRKQKYLVRGVQNESEPSFRREQPSALIKLAETQDSRGRNQVVRAEVPMGEALSYATELRSMTSGQGYFTQNFSHYDEVPLQLAGKVVKARREEQET